MSPSKTAPETIDEYIATFPKAVQEVLGEVRKTIRKTAPRAEETIKYGMPAFTLNGNLVFFAAFKNHIGLYSAPRTGSEKFKKELSAYQGVKGSVKFPLDKPIPFDLIGKIVKIRVKENLERTKATAKKK
jgi:uncharacterized protein YdhG (YjbR/CyaY superfamily)